MSDDDLSIQYVRAANIRLEHENQVLKSTAIQLQKELVSVREQLESERQLVKNLRHDKSIQVRKIRENENKKYENIIKDLKTRLDIERSQSLENQRLQLERNFRSELMKLIHQKDSQLHLLFAHSQRVKREADKNRLCDRERYEGAYRIHFDKVKHEFGKQLTRLILELKSKEREYARLEKAMEKLVARKPYNSRRRTSSSRSSSTSSTLVPATQPCDHHQKGPSKISTRNKSYQERRRMIQHPYGTCISSPLGGRHEARLKMRETGETQPMEQQQFFYHHHFGGSALETLPEAESEEECSEGEDVSESGAPCTTTSCSSQASDDNFCLSHGANIELRNVGNHHHHLLLRDDGSGTSNNNLRYESSPEDQRHKISSLEETIRQLRDELRECKDQNELLEFRLLEIEEIGGSSNSQGGKDGRKCGKNNRNLLPSAPTLPLYHEGRDEPTEAVIRRDFDNASNSHASVAESRSSCSDCSDSLSLQESGIFDSQSVNDDFHSSGGSSNGGGGPQLPGFCNLLGSRDDMSRELGNLTSQIENLVIRFTEEGNELGGGNIENEIDGAGEEGSSPCHSRASESPSRGFDGNLGSLSGNVSPGSGTGSIKTKSRKGTNIRSELKNCRERIKEFEKRLTQFADINYVNSLEDKVSLLVNDNQRLEEEKSELEEAENDSRHQCQRLEERVLELGQKKGALEEELCDEKLFVEQLRIKILQLQEREEDLSAQILRVDALVQDFEHRNFELEESCIDIKCSLQFVVHSLPVLVLWYLWAVLKRFQVYQNSALPPQRQYSKRNLLSIQHIPENLSAPGASMSRKHKLTSPDPTSAEPTLKKLRAADHQLESLRFRGYEMMPAIREEPRIEEEEMEDCCVEGWRSERRMEDSRTFSGRDSECQTSEDSWKGFINDIILIQQREWERVEITLKGRIGELECQIQKYETERRKGQADDEREMKLQQQGNLLEKSQHFLQERQSLQEKWDNLIRELEELVGNGAGFVVGEAALVAGSSLPSLSSHGENSRVKGENNPLTGGGDECRGGNEESVLVANPGNSQKKNEGEKVKSGGGLVAHRIRSLFPGEWKKNRGDSGGDTKSGSKNAPPPLPLTPAPTATESTFIPPHFSSVSNFIADSKLSKKNLLVSRLEEAFMEQVSKFEGREKVLLDEINALKREMRRKEEERLGLEERYAASNSTSDAWTTTGDVFRSDSPPTAALSLEEENDKSQIVYLTEENNRLHIILSDQETIVSRVRELEEENESLSLELAASLNLKRRLEDAHGVETNLRNRIEELELSEINSRELVDEAERRERKCVDRIAQLREETQFLRNKSCQLQDELDMKISRENKYNNEIQSLKSKVKSLNAELEEKEGMLENNISSSQAQISKLRSQLHELQEQLGELECTNGMLREEVLYLEKTLQEAMERAAGSEKMVAILQSELQQQESNVEWMRQKIESAASVGADAESSSASNDLDVFAQNEGGLFGVDRDIKTIASQIQNCGREGCKRSSQKLIEVSEQLNTLTMMLGGSQDMGRINGDAQGFPELMSRCESDECLSRNSMVSEEGVERDAKDGSVIEVSQGSVSSEVISQGTVTTVAIIQTHSFLPIQDEERGVQVMRLQEAVGELNLKICEMEDIFKSRTKEIRESHHSECSWYSWRCRQKNDLIQVLARRIAHLSATDRHGIFLESILAEIKLLEEEKGYSNIYQVKQITGGKKGEEKTGASSELLDNDELDFTYESLILFLNYERKRIMDLMESACQDDDIESSLDEDEVVGGNNEELEFRICRRVSEDSLLVAWSLPDVSREKVDGYEISVNGNVFLRIPQRNRSKAVLYGLNLREPLHLSLKCSGGSEALKLQESTITYIA